MNLRKTLFILPNLFTLSSIFCGFEAMRRVATAGTPEATPDRYYAAALLLVFAMFFDIVDGRVARMTRTQSAFGLQFDSLADVVSFGVAPALLTYRWALAGMGNLGAAACFVFLGCGAIRLARFNVLAMRGEATPSRPGRYIVGLPIPGAAGMLIALVIANHQAHLRIFASSSIILALTLGLSALMVSTVRFRSFKDVRLGWRAASMIALAVGSSLAVARTVGPGFALPWLLGCYITIGLVESVVTFPRRHAARRAARAAGTTPPSDDGP